MNFIVFVALLLEFIYEILIEYWRIALATNDIWFFFLLQNFVLFQFDKFCHGLNCFFVSAKHNARMAGMAQNTCFIYSLLIVNFYRMIQLSLGVYCVRLSIIIFFTELYCVSSIFQWYYIWKANINSVARSACKTLSNVIKTNFLCDII